LDIDVLGQPIRPIFKGNAFQEECLKMRPIGCPETSVTNYIPFYAAKNHRRAKISFKPRRKPEVLHNW